MKRNPMLHLLLVMTCFFGFTFKPSVNLSDSKADPELRSIDSDRYLEPIFENVDILEDVVFGETTTMEGEIEKLLVDIYEPAGDKLKKRPAILWIHGGGFRKGKNDKQQRYIVSMANAFAHRGYVCFSINYRVRDDPKADKTGTMTDALEDAMKGLQWVRANSKKYNIDKHKIIVGGGSAGGMIAVNLCYKDEKENDSWDNSGVIGLVNLWGSPDESWRMSTIDAGDPPTIIVHGTDDESVPFVNTERLAAELKNAGVKHEVVAIAGARHTPASHMEEFNINISRFLFDLLSEK